MDKECDGKVSNRKDVKDEEIFDLVGSDGINVWGHNQNDLEQQALSHLKSLTEAQNSKEDLAEDGEICDSDSTDQSSSKKLIVGSGININKYLENQAKLQNCHVLKKNNSVSEKSKAIANKLSELNFRKQLKVNKQEKKLKVATNSSCEQNTSKNSGLRRKSNDSDSDYYPSSKQEKRIKVATDTGEEQHTIKRSNKSNNDSDSDYYPSDELESDNDIYGAAEGNLGTKRKRTSSKNTNIDEKTKDDGLLAYYTSRLQSYNENKIDLDEEEQIQDNLKVPKSIWDKLYDYQQDGIKWMWNIHKQTIGGLLGDEMGLGKTVQVIVFLCALEYSKIKSCNGRFYGLGPSIVVCPATVIHQWVKHFHDWWPPFRVALLHQSGTYSGNKIQLINDIHKNNGILVTTYESILKYKGVLIEKNWHYLILDEGHKIRNPSAKITVAVKHFRTPHKLILTGSPMQNNLQELWSLYDFIVPGKLGSQQAFMDYFVTPIVHGGYVNATPTQETTALLIATSLRDMINPYMLRRTKDEVKDSIYLPNKSEQVLFCSLTDEQKDLYRGYLLSDHVGSILGRTSSARVSENQGRANVLVGITTLRKICNHPDLYLGEADEVNDPKPNEVTPIEKTFGYYKRSGKMIVVAALLKIWKRQGHRVLLFTQTRSMVDIFEDFLTQQEYKYLKMDGATSIGSRQSIINTFNQDTSYDVFILTTRVGGLGVNLTGANRVVIYDPDWNPATDTQARERAWRIGQLKQVTVYRLVSAGTIEEKMYQRQIWKQLLSNKILIDPRTKRFFKTSDLTDLFSLQEQTDKNPETANIFKNSKIEVNSSHTSSCSNSDITFSKDKIDAMKSLAQQIAKNIQPKEKKINLDVEKSDKTINRPTPVELLAINRKKLEVHEEPIVNKLDDRETNTTFSEALVAAAERSTDYHKKDDKQQPVEDKTKNKKKKEEKVKIDNSGQINGEKIEGLLKREVKKKEKVKTKNKTSQDDYVLQKLFSKKGVHTALQHDVIIQSGNPNRNNLKIHYEAKHKADMALNALRKSRMKNWRW